MGFNPVDLELGVMERRRPRSEAAVTYMWAGRLADLAWILGSVLAGAYILTTGEIETKSLAMLAFSLVGLIVTFAIPWGRSKRWWILPVALYATFVIALASAWLDKPGISAFYLFPLLFVSYFYWGNAKVMAGTYVVFCTIYIGAEVVRPGEINLDQLIVALPTYLAASVMVGVLAARFRRLSRSERRRFKATVEALCTALSARDGYTGEHSAETLDLVTSVTRELGLSPEDIEQISDVALLHDIGKIGIPNEILHSPGRLTDEQWEVMKQHPVIGERIVGAIPGLESVAKAIRHEHERWDGLGYPDGLKKEEIPLASRIVLVCDAYHAMTSDRPYRKALFEHDARAELVRNAGTQFDPVVVGALLSALSRQRSSTIVRQTIEEVEIQYAFPQTAGKLAQSGSG
jgi:HD-GYP domain-containing protein (c-di-GMP phosphodiesterase class II)